MLYIYILAVVEPLFWWFCHRFQQYDGRRHRFGGGRWSHYYNSRPTGDGGMMVKETNLPAITKATILVVSLVWALAAFFEATILPIHLPVGHYLAVQWVARPIWRRLLDPLFRRFSRRTSTTSGSIGRASGVGNLLKI